MDDIHVVIDNWEEATQMIRDLANKVRKPIPTLSKSKTSRCRFEQVEMVMGVYFSTFHSSTSLLIIGTINIHQQDMEAWTVESRV